MTGSLRPDWFNPKPKAWAVHPAAPKLAALADRFVKRHRRSGLIRMMYARYFKAGSRFAIWLSERI